jgi:hypothetical protein
MIPDLDTASEHGQYARDAGLADVDVRDVTANMRQSLRRLYVLSLAGVPVSWMLHKLCLRGAISHGNVLGSMNQYRALRRGSWAYSILCARKPTNEPNFAQSRRQPGAWDVAG